MDLNCRVCLQVRDVMVHIFDEVQPQELAKLLNECGGVEVFEDDNFPKYLCRQCTQELLIAADFREKCRKSNALLLEMGSCKNLYESFDDLIVFEAENRKHLEENDESKTREIYDNSSTAEIDCPQYSIKISTIEQAGIDCPQYSIEIPMIKQSEIDEGFSLKSAVDIEVNQNNVLEDIIEETPIEVETIENEEILNSFTNQTDEKKMTCKECGAVFVKSINLQRHLENEHNISSNFFCENCQRNLDSKTAYEEHNTFCSKKIVKILSNGKLKLIDGKKATCHICGKSLQSNFALRMHLRTHTGERPFGCSICNSQFKTQSALAVHSKRHNGTADIECEICHKRFFEKSNLNVHMRTHTGDRPHICNICKRGFSRVSLLQHHMRTHTGERPYQCAHCERSFTQRSVWKSHLAIHTGEHRFQCNVCSKGFMKRQQFELHKEKQCAQTTQNVLLNFEVSI